MGKFQPNPSVFVIHTYIHTYSTVHTYIDAAAKKKKVLLIIIIIIFRTHDQTSLLSV